MLSIHIPKRAGPQALSASSSTSSFSCSFHQPSILDIPSAQAPPAPHFSFLYDPAMLAMCSLLPSVLLALLGCPLLISPTLSSHGLIQLGSTGHVQSTIFSPCSRLFQMPHIYHKNLLLNHTLEWSCPHVLPLPPYSSRSFGGEGRLNPDHGGGED